MEQNKCDKCGGEGLIHQGESIHHVCSKCTGTGKVGELSNVTSSTKMEENIPAPAPTEESFLENSGEASAPAPESEASAE